jgi:hypothetical protein
VIDGTETRREPQALGGRERELGVKDDPRWGEAGVTNCVLLALLVGEACSNRVLCGGQRRRNGDLILELPACLLLEVVDDGLGCIDRRAAANRHDDVRVVRLERLKTIMDARDWRMLPDLGECAGVRIVSCENSGYLLDHVALVVLCSVLEVREHKENTPC